MTQTHFSKAKAVCHVTLMSAVGALSLAEGHADDLKPDPVVRQFEKQLPKEFHRHTFQKRELPEAGFTACRAQPGLRHVFMTTPKSGNPKFVTLSEIDYESIGDARCGKSAFVSNSDPGRGYSFGWEIVAQRGNKLYHFSIAYSQPEEGVPGFARSFLAPFSREDSVGFCAKASSCKLMSIAELNRTLD